jgi:hypothetical protein
MKFKIPIRNSRKTLLLFGMAVVPAVGLGAYFALQPPPRVAMSRYAPAGSLGFAEIYSLGDVVDGLTSTRAWRELAPVLGLSSQLREIGTLVNAFGRTGLGPDEVVIAGRAQFALAVTGLEVAASNAEDDPYVRFKPHVALIIETHSSPVVADRVARERIGVLARRIFGDSTAEDSDNYQGVDVRTFHGPDPTRQMLAAATGTLILVSNDRSALDSCLDAIAGRVPSLADDQVLVKFRPVVDRQASIFGYLTSTGIDKLSTLVPALVSTRFTTDPEQIDSIANLFHHISGQAVQGFLYGSQFTASGVTDRYLAVVSPWIASGMSETFKSSGAARDRDCLRFVPRFAKDFTVVNIDGLGGLPERALKRISPGLDVVGGLALREFVLSFFKQLNVTSPDLVQKAFGDQMTLVRFDPAEIGIIAEIKDRPSLSAYIQGYLGQKGARVWTENYKGVEINASSAEDGRAAAFKGGYLLIGNRARVRQMIDSENGDTGAGENHSESRALCGASAGSIRDDGRVMLALNQSPSAAPLISVSPCPEEAGRFMLQISELTRTTDGSPEILERDEAKRAFERVPASVSVTEFRDIGVYTETRSAIGNLSLIVSLASGETI